jgi:hypothetical protein
MWVINAIVILTVLAFGSWILINYRKQLGKSARLVSSGTQSILFAIYLFGIQIVRSLLLSALGGGLICGIFLIAGAPLVIAKGIGFSLGAIVFSLLIIKALVENWYNLRWSFRHDVRNIYGKSKSR